MPYRGDEVGHGSPCLRFTWRMLEDHPEKVWAAVLELVAARSSAS